MARMRLEVMRCSNGHFYSSEHGTCPFCSGSRGMESMLSENLQRGSVEEYAATAPVNPVNIPKQDSFSKSEPSAQQVPSSWTEVEEYGSTMPVGPEVSNPGFDPVVGWLVCINGANRGKSYRLHSGANFIGRSKGMDVCIDSDKTISNERAACLAYDDRSRMFFLERGEGRNPVYCSGSVVSQPRQLEPKDRITIGNTELIFMPLCSDRFSWANI